MIRIEDREVAVGAEIDFSRTEWIPTGTADAVVFLGERVAGDVMTPLGESGEKVWQKIVTRESQERIALRYLRPCSAKWHEENPSRHGLTCCPDVRGMVKLYPKELSDLSVQEKVRIDHQFCTESPFAENPWLIFDPKHAAWVKTEEDGIWCVFYEE